MVTIQTFVPGPPEVAQAQAVQVSTGTLAGSGLGRMAPVTGNSLQPGTACAQNNAGHLCSQIQHAHRTMLDISSYTQSALMQPAGSAPIEGASNSSSHEREDTRRRINKQCSRLECVVGKKTVQLSDAERAERTYLHAERAELIA